MSAKVKVADVARAAAVSPAVVYSLMNGRYYGRDGNARIGISAQTRERIRSVCRDLDFRPDDLLSRVRLRPELGGFLMMLADSVRDAISHPFYSKILRGVSTHAEKSRRGTEFCVFSGLTDYLLNEDLLPMSVQSGLVNKVVVAGNVNYSLLLALRKVGCAVAYASRNIGLEDIHGVVPDYRDAALQAMRHLTSLGHRRIALAAGHYVDVDAYYRRELIAGTTEAWAQLGMVDPAPTFVQSRNKDVDAPDFLRQILREAGNPSAIFCFDDYTALGLVSTAIAEGIRVPAQLSIMGCNNEGRPSPVLPLTTVQVPKVRIGETCGWVLDEVIAGRNEGKTLVERLPVELIVRASTQAVAG